MNQPEPWQTALAMRLVGSEATVIIEHGSVDRLLDITLLVDGRLVRKSTCSIDHLIEKMFMVTVTGT